MSAARSLEVTPERLTQDIPADKRHPADGRDLQLVGERTPLATLSRLEQHPHLVAAFFSPQQISSSRIEQLRANHTEDDMYDCCWCRKANLTHHLRYARCHHSSCPKCRWCDC